MQLPVLITAVTNISNRVKTARQARNLTQAQLARQAGVSQGTIGNLESGLRQSPRELLRIAAALGVSAEWLSSGKEDALALQQDSNVSSAEMRARVPLISWVTAGQMGDVQDIYLPGQADDWVHVYDTKPSPSTFALQVAGDSMTSPIPGDVSFPDGTIIVVDPNRSVDPGNYVVAKDVTTQKATFKRLAYDAGRWYLKPLNPSYPMVEIDDPAVRVIGKVIEYQTRGKL